MRAVSAPYLARGTRFLVESVTKNRARQIGGQNGSVLLRDRPVRTPSSSLLPYDS